MYRPMVRAATLLVGAVALLSCAGSGRVEQADYARTALVGMPRETLFSCAGVPDRTRSEGAREYLTYESGRTYSRGGSGFALGGGFFHDNIGIGAGVPFGYDVESEYCETTFTVDNGYVSEILYNSVSGYGGTRIGQCYYVVQSCLDLVPPMPQS